MATQSSSYSKVIDRFLTFSSIDLPFTNPTFGTDMAQNVEFFGVPEIVHDGTDTTAWTGSAISGTWDFANSDHARNAKATVLDYTALSGATVTITINAVSTVLTEGIDWIAATDNDTTAASVATALNNISGITATSSLNVVTVLTEKTTDITQFVTSALPGDLLTSAKNVDGTGAIADGDTALFTAPSPILASNFSTLTGSVRIESWLQTGFKDAQLQFRLAGTNVGIPVSIGAFVSRFTFNRWLDYAISLGVFGLTTESIDELIITNYTTGEGSAPGLHHDKIQVEQIGVPITYTLKPEQPFLGIPLESSLTDIKYTIEGPLVPTLDGTGAPILPLDGLMGIPDLPNGIVFQFIRGGFPIFVLVFNNLGDLIETATGGIDDFGTNEDGTKSWVTLRVDFPQPQPFNASTGDEIRIIITDNLNSLTRFGVTGRSIFNFPQ